ncbi:MAG: FAD-binding oxidoreductase [Chloroflexota bacterium]
MRNSTALIIGGGVIGLSTAYHLAKKKFGHIIILEKGAIGDGASSRAGGIITDLLWTKAGVEARKISLELYADLSRELEPFGYQFQDVGCLNLFSPNDWPEREALLPLYDDLDVPYEILDAEAMHHRWPDLTPAKTDIGLHDPLGGYSEPHHYLPALSNRLHDLGVDFREGQMMTDFLIKNGHIRGVKTTAGDIEADVVICTAHVWTNRLFERLDWALPMKAFVHQRYVSTALPAPLNIPATNANPYLGYIRPADGNRILAGAETPERTEFEVLAIDYEMAGLTVPSAVPANLETTLTALVPKLADTTWETEKIGLLSFSSDMEPILGPIDRFPGLYIGSAFHSGGFAYNPVAGLLLAEYVADGQTSINVDGFSPMRFSKAETQQHLAATIAQKDVGRRRH